MCTYRLQLARHERPRRHTGLHHRSNLKHLKCKLAKLLCDACLLCTPVHMCAGCNWHGMNDPDATQDSITEDFLIFCKLAVLHEAIPPDWDWDRLLRTAAKRLHYHFDKDNAIEAWGCAIALRHTAEVVHGVSMLGPGRGGMLRSGGDDGQALERVTEQVQGRWQQLVAAEGDMFEDVGGVQAWKKLHSKLYFERE